MAARKGASRREILKMAGVGTAGLAVAPLVVAKTRTSLGRVRRAPVGQAPAVAKPATDAATASADVRAAQAAEAAKQAKSAKGYLADLVGKRIGTYRVESVGALKRGGIPIEMKTAGGVRFRVDVLRFDPLEGNRGIGDLSSVTVYLCNGGNGRKETDEELGLGAMALAKELARREREGGVPPRGLLTMGERAASDASFT